MRVRARQAASRWLSHLHGRAHAGARMVNVGNGRQARRRGRYSGARPWIVPTCTPGAPSQPSLADRLDSRSVYSFGVVRCVGVRPIPGDFAGCVRCVSTDATRGFMDQVIDVAARRFRAAAGVGERSPSTGSQAGQVEHRMQASDSTARRRAESPAVRALIERRRWSRQPRAVRRCVDLTRTCGPILGDARGRAGSVDARAGPAGWPDDHPAATSVDGASSTVGRGRA